MSDRILETLPLPGSHIVIKNLLIGQQVVDRWAMSGASRWLRILSRMSGILEMVSRKSIKVAPLLLSQFSWDLFPFEVLVLLLLVSLSSSIDDSA